MCIYVYIYIYIERERERDMTLVLRLLPEFKAAAPTNASSTRAPGALERTFGAPR